MAILVTGGAGFIGSNFILDWFNDPQTRGELLVNLDALTYAGNLENLRSLDSSAGYRFVLGDITDSKLLGSILADLKPRAICHFAAESHVDRSIAGPKAFVETNVVGTFNLLEASRAYLLTLPAAQQRDFRFLHVSTDEVFGSLGPADAPFSESSSVMPNSPYSASKAASDHFVRAWHHTYGMPVITTHCSNNYGPYQFPEKLVPLMILNAIAGKALPIYGNGLQVRDWLFVSDHCRALRLVLQHGRVGETYNIGGSQEMTNLQVARSICDLLDQLHPSVDGAYSRLITHVQDRPGHDRRYAIDSRKLSAEVGWSPVESFESGLKKTVAWYLAQQEWVGRVQSGAYRRVE